MTQIRLRIVGENVIEVGNKRLTPTSPQLFALVLFLAIEHQRDVPRAELLELLYPDDSRLEFSHRLRQSLYKLKSMGAPLDFGDGTVRADGAKVINDVARLLSDGWEHRKERLLRSFEVLPHYRPPSCAPLIEWVEDLRDRMHNSLRQQLTHDFDIARRKADWRYLEALARRTLELDPLNETAILGLAEATARAGSKVLAVSMLDAYRAELGDERAALALPASLLEKRINSSRERTLSMKREPLPFLGRKRELESLLAQWETARRGGAHALWLTGSKSVGKTRLAEELAANVLIGGSSRVVSFAMSPVDADRPLSLFAALANRFSSLPGAAACDPLSLQALGKLSGSISIPSAVNPENTNSTYSDAAIRNAICDLVGCVTDERAVLVVVDDAQHLDDASAHLLDVVLSRVADKRLLVVLCGTPESASAAGGHTILHLEPLSGDAAQELWQALLAANELHLPDQTSRMCIDTAGGNPGHMELLAQQAALDPEQFFIPVDLITLTDRRLSQLPPHARYVLEAMVVLDDAATTTSVAHLTGLTTYELITALQVLEGSDLIANSRTGLRCRSGFVAERVRLTSPSTVTSLMEGRAAEYLEKEQSGERWSPSMAWRIASHWQRAGEAHRARAYLRACWQHSVSIGQPAKASAAINEALAVASDPEDRASLLDDLIGTLQAAGDTRGVIPAVEERRSLNSRVHDSAERHAELAFDADEAHWFRESDPLSHLELLRAHLESPLLDSHRRIRAARMLIITADLELDPKLAAYAVEGSRNITPESATSRLLHRHVSLIYHTIFGDRDRALQLADELEQHIKHTELSWYNLISRRNCAFARQLAGFGPSDYDSLERGYAGALDASMTLAAFGFAAYLASMLIDDGDLTSAQRWLIHCEELATSFSESDLPSDYLGAQIDLSLLLGNAKKAQRYLRIVEKYWSRFRPRRMQNESRIYRLRVQQHCAPTAVNDADVTDLLAYHEIGKRLTRHDDHMEVLWTALNAVGESERASALLSEYLLQHRRERRPSRYFLRHRTARDPIWRRLGAQGEGPTAV
jgi:DNA-binding SARP family transcriptional activator